MLRRLVQNLGLYASLTPADRAAVEALPATLRRFDLGEDIVVEGDAPSQCRILLKGLAFRHRTLPDARRQIMAFNVAGDVCDTEGLLLSMDHGVTALTVAEVAFVSHAAMESLLDAQPRVSRALWRTILVENAIAREWLVGVGRRSAKARVAHLFCEMVTRLRAAGLEEQGRFHFPVTQAHLGDALGLSVVHTNRVLQQLRGEELIRFRGGELTVLNWAGLQAAGEFDPGYLHLKDKFVWPAPREVTSRDRPRRP